MTLSEFKAWFEGFSEGIDKVPNAKQFEKIKAKVAEINGAPITQTIFVDRYVRPYPSHWEHPYATWGDPHPLKTWYGTSKSFGTDTNPTFGANSQYAYIDPASKGDNQTVEFDIHAAMRELGRAEALN